jgi:hypothetical protein
MTDKKFEVAGNVSIVSTGKTVVSKEQFETVVDNAIKGPEDVGAGSSLTDMYDRFSKLIYAIDASGSMGEGMLSEDSIKMYKWTPDILEQFKARMRADKDLTEENFDEITEDDNGNEVIQTQHIDVDGMSEDELKMYIISEHLDDKYSIRLEMNYSHNTRGRSKMMALKDAAKDFVHTRFQKFADARVGVFSFEDHPSQLCAAGAVETEVLAAINRLPDNGGGGTNIYSAVDRVVNECKRRPSEVGLNHIVLVSDGCDGGAMRVEELVPKMKELGIVFDFIYMLGLSPDAQGEQVAAMMRRVCEATGGEYTVVKTEQDFVQKFLEVSKRPMLPAPK